MCTEHSVLDRHPISELCLSLNYPRHNLATCLSSPARVTRPIIGCGTPIMIRLHHQTHPSSLRCFRGCSVCTELWFRSVTSLLRAKPTPISCFSAHFIFSFKQTAVKPNTICSHLQHVTFLIFPVSHFGFSRRHPFRGT